jgi:hypothetical protein
LTAASGPIPTFASLLGGRYCERMSNPLHWCGEFEVPISVAASLSWKFQIQSRYSNQ